METLKSVTKNVKDQLIKLKRQEFILAGQEEFTKEELKELFELNIDLHNSLVAALLHDITSKIDNCS